MLMPFCGLFLTKSNKIGGVFALLASFSVLFLLPFLQFSPFRSLAHRPLSQIFFLLFTGNFLLLTWVGGLPVEDPYILVGQISSIFYFCYFLIISPLVSFLENHFACVA